MLFQPAIIVRFRLSFKCETISYRKLVVCRYPPRQLRAVTHGRILSNPAPTGKQFDGMVPHCHSP
jgi:hypothetical protein